MIEEISLALVIDEIIKKMLCLGKIFGREDNTQ